MKALLLVALTSSLFACDPTHTAESITLSDASAAKLVDSSIVSEPMPESMVSTVVFGDDAKGLYLGLAEMGVNLSAGTGAMHADRLVCLTENEDPARPSCGLNSLKSSQTFYSVLDTLTYFLAPTSDRKQLAVYQVECRIVDSVDFECRFKHSGI